MDFPSVTSDIPLAEQGIICRQRFHRGDNRAAIDGRSSCRRPSNNAGQMYTHRPASDLERYVEGAAPSGALGIEARLVALLDELQALHFITRQRSATDRRSHALQLTSDGHAAVKEANHLVATHEEKLIERVRYLSQIASPPPPWKY